MAAHIYTSDSSNLNVISSKLDGPVARLKLADNPIGTLSSRTFTVPIGKTWIIQGLRAYFTTTATAGDRRMLFLITDGSQPIYDNYAMLLQAPSTTATYIFAPCVESGSLTGTFLNGTVYNKILVPEWVLGAGQQIIIADYFGIDGEADNITATLSVGER